MHSLHYARAATELRSSLEMQLLSHNRPLRTIYLIKKGLEKIKVIFFKLLQT